MSETPPVSNEFGTRISARRKELGLNTQQLADLAAIARPQLSMIENGRRPANDEHALRLASALSLDPREALLLATRDRLPAEARAMAPVPPTPQVDASNQAASQAAPYRFDQVSFEQSVGLDQMISTTYRIKGCLPTPGRPVHEIIFRESASIADHTLPTIQVTSFPPSLRRIIEYGTIPPEGSDTFYTHRIGFRREWTETDGPIDFAMVSTRRPPSSGTGARAGDGRFGYRVTHPTRRLLMTIRFETGAAAPARWLRPEAWWGRDQSAATNEIQGAFARSAGITTTARVAVLDIEHPLTNATLAIVWSMLQDQG